MESPCFRGFHVPCAAWNSTLPLTATTLPWRAKAEAAEGEENDDGD
jgi:hypothetical protein